MPSRADKRTIGAAIKHGRVNQKTRTRATLLSTAIRLIREGLHPSVDEVAQAAGISKRTAYRYFVSREHLLADASIGALRPEIDRIVGEALRRDDAPSRLDALIRALHRTSFLYEAELTTIIRLSLDSEFRTKIGSKGQLRSERRVQWIEQALAPIRTLLDARSYARLVSALCIVVGIDAVLILRDIRHLAPKEIEQVALWTSRALLHAALADVRTKPRTARNGRRHAAGRRKISRRQILRIP
jgi:AcrR family transcriptional regulator